MEGKQFYIKNKKLLLINSTIKKNNQKYATNYFFFFFKIRSCWHNWNGFQLSNNYRRDFPTAPKNGESPTPLGAICVTRTLISFRDAVLVVNRTHNRDKRVSILESYGIPGDAHKKGDLAVRAAVRSIWHLNPCALFAQSRQYTGMEESTGHKHAVRGLSSPAGGVLLSYSILPYTITCGLTAFRKLWGVTEYWIEPVS